MNGTIFDIKEFSVFDGPGVRVTVFLKGCPLRCKWCHNPEGLRVSPQIMVSAVCQSCGKCRVSDCNVVLGKECNGCGRCVSLCPDGFRKLSGKDYTPKQLVDRLIRYEPFFSPEGGITFSGGEPTLQADFLCETMKLLPFHKVVQTCGYCHESDFKRVLELVDMMFFDIKLIDPVKHKEWTGADNAVILENLKILKASGKPFIARIPLIEGVNDDEENLTATAELLADANSLLQVELLPYNGAAGAKYKMVGQPFPYDFHAPSSPNTSPFTARGIKAVVR